MSESAQVPAPSAPPRYVNTSTLLIGVTGSGKSTLLATAAEYMWETHRAITAYYMSDLGGYPDRMSALIRSGIVWLFNMRTRGTELSFETAQLSSKGYWPSRVLNPLTGEVPEGVRMAGPLRTSWMQRCDHCGHERQVQYKSLLGAGQCPGCSRRIVLAATTTRQVTVPTPGLDRIKLRMYDGITSMSEWYLQDLSHRKELGGEIGAIGGVIVSGDLSFRGNNRAQVGFAQTRAHELISNSLTIPNQLIAPIWTALANETTDSTGRLTIVGPKLAGDAKTEAAPAWFGNTIEAAMVEGERSGSKRRRLYLSEYFDSENRRHILKHRSDPRYMPEFLQDEEYSADAPPQEICTQFNLGVFFQHLATADQKALEAVQERYPDAPGLLDVPVSFEVEVPEESPAGAGAGAGTNADGTSPVAGAAAPAGKPGLARPRGRKAGPVTAPAVPAVATPAPVEDAAPVATRVPLETAEGAAVSSPQTPEDVPPVAEPVAAAPIASPATPAPSLTPTPSSPAPARAAAPPPPPAAGWAPPPGARPVRAGLATPIRRPVPPPGSSSASS